MATQESDYKVSSPKSSLDTLFAESVESESGYPLKWRCPTSEDRHGGTKELPVSIPGFPGMQLSRVDIVKRGTESDEKGNIIDQGNRMIVELNRKRGLLGSQTCYLIIDKSPDGNKTCKFYRLSKAQLESGKNFEFDKERFSHSASQPANENHWKGDSFASDLALATSDMVIQDIDTAVIRGVQRFSNIKSRS